MYGHDVRMCARTREIILLRTALATTEERAHPDLNQGPADLQSAALTTELCTLGISGGGPRHANRLCSETSEVALAMDPKSIGLRLKELESPRCRFAPAASTMQLSP